MFRERRSIRKFTEQPIQPDVLKVILENTLSAPTSKNRRPWAFVVVQDKAVLKDIANTREVGSAFVKDAACAVVVIANPQVSEIWIEDTAIAAFAIQLAAHEQGLGSCWVQVRERAHNDTLSASNYLKALLNIPAAYEVASVIAMGYPAEQKEPHAIEALLAEKIHYNRF